MSAANDLAQIREKIERIEAYLLRTFGEVEASVDTHVGGAVKLVWQQRDVRWRLVLRVDHPRVEYPLAGAPPDDMYHAITHLPRLAEALDKATKDERAQLALANNKLDELLNRWMVDV